MLAQQDDGKPRRWQDEAICRGLDPSLFFATAASPEGGVHDPNVYDAGRAICMTCPVREPCLEHALTYRERFGLWGGLSEEERRRVIRARRRRGGQQTLEL